MFSECRLDWVQIRPILSPSPLHYPGFTLLHPAVVPLSKPLHTRLQRPPFSSLLPCALICSKSETRCTDVSYTHWGFIITNIHAPRKPRNPPFQQSIISLSFFLTMLYFPSPPPPRISRGICPFIVIKTVKKNRRSALTKTSIYKYSDAALSQWSLSIYRVTFSSVFSRSPSLLLCS